MASGTVRVAEVEAAAYVVSPAKVIPIGYEPAVAGAVVTTEATPELFVVAVRVAPLSVKVTVFPEIAVPDPVLSFALRVIVAPGAAVVGPVYGIPQNVWYSVDGVIAFHMIDARGSPFGPVSQRRKFVTRAKA